MLNLTVLSKQNTQAQQRSVSCIGYWPENNMATSISGTTFSHDPINTPELASFYKESSN